MEVKLMSKKSKQGNAIKTEISVHPGMEGSISKFQMECLEDEIKILPDIKDGEVDVNTDFFFDLGDKYEASVFIRNGLATGINLEKIPFIVLGKNDEELGRKVFNLREVGEIPARSVRPWKIYFEKDELEVGENNLKDLKIIFDSRLKAAGVVKVRYENLPGGIQGQERKKYEDFLENLPLLREGQVTMTAYDVHITEEGKIAVELVIRNGRHNGVDVERVPLSVYDANHKLVVSGVFYLEDVSISPISAKVYSFSFSKEEILREDFDLKKWTVEFMLNSNVN
ncbi:hypothetical protein ADU80_05980 [Clostridium botulinum]|uniref:SLAP domain-containing protein n=2 Tax=Clostridium botulinum TaxID=1491 RepID=A0A9Q1UZP1_CLOBO|nr:conserved protein, putative [Clostridium botulinum BKT015925]KEH99049.1 hypothetical protein Z953_12055 [Clostridium botulinum D str. 16868]KEI03751.1 hypothetical protein Y848_04315 [Clostridium botulinum C/D str. Sp77]KLU76376.1 hypothetical protein CBC3_04010 [Clostridium botulinum V891]KOA73620.1 hypothetical protein ADU78_11910 [Clostridium botulinum]MCD3197392.1 SLAP domain-containing protein [Clostridium botulinum C/D]